MNELNDMKYYGAFIRLNREAQNLSLKALSEISGFSVAQISKIERGIETANETTLSCIFEALSFKLNDIQDEISSLQNDFLNFYKKVIYYELNTDYKKLKEEIEAKFNDYISVEILLLNLIYSLTFENDLKSSYEILQVLKSIFDCLDLTYKQIIYNYVGAYYIVSRKFVNAIYYLNQSLNIEGNKLTTNMTYYYLGISYRKNKQILKAYNSMIQAKQLFSSSNNFIRSCMCDLAIANIHSTNGEYAEALSLLDECLVYYKRLNMPVSETARIYSTVLLINILNEDYKEAYRILNGLDSNVLEVLEKKDAFILYKVILHLHYNHKDAALKLCNRVRYRYNEDNIDHNFILYYYYLIKNNKKKRMNYLQKNKGLIEKSASYIDYRFLFKLLNIECTTEKQLAEFKDALMNYIFNSFN